VDDEVFMAPRWPSDRSMIPQWFRKHCGPWLVVAVSAAAGLVSPLAASADSIQQGAHPRQTPAARGVSYLIERAEEMSPGWRQRVFPVLAKFIPDARQAETCRELGRAALAEPVSELHERFSKRTLAWPRDFAKTLAELVRRKTIDAQWREPTSRLSSLIARNESILWEKLGPTQRLITLRHFESLGIATTLRQADVVASLQTRWSSEDRDRLVEDAPFMFGITHVIYLRSDYFDRMLDPADHRSEIDVLDRATERYARGLPDPTIFLDVAAEVLAARRLLAQPESDASREVVRHILALQQPDGHWGENRLERDVHATATAIQALSEWAQPFRKFTPK